MRFEAETPSIRDRRRTCLVCRARLRDYRAASARVAALTDVARTLRPVP
jgi:hypothetical protein